MRTFPTGFESRRIAAGDAEIFVRRGGHGPLVVLLHGHPQDGQVWAPLAADLARDHTVIVPDLRGLGRSSRPASGYDKRTQARDVRAVIEALGFDEAALVGHDVGGAVAYAYAASFPSKVTKLVFMDAPIPGVGPWEEALKIPALWHWNFGGPAMERLVEGRERIYHEHFWSFAADPSKIDDAARDHYAAAYAEPGAMRAAFAQFAAFAQDARDNAVLGLTMLAMPVLAVGAERGFGTFPGAFMRSVATDVQEVIVPDTGHWLMDENPEATGALVRDFVDRPTPKRPLESRRIVARDVDLFVQVGGSGSPVVLLHGYVQSGDMWGPLAAALATRHTVIVPDLRGLGRSSRPADGYSKKNQAHDVRAVIQALGFDRAVVIGHDLGGMVAYAYAAQYASKVSRLAILEAAPPGVDPWNELAKLPALWHFSFRGPEAERLVQGRERVYFDRFWNAFSADPSKIGDSVRNQYAAQYALPGAMRAGFAQFAAFAEDVVDNARFAQNKLTIPVLAVGGAEPDKAFGPMTAIAMRNVATRVREVLIPGAAHWLLEENPEATVSAVMSFVEEDDA